MHSIKKHDVKVNVLYLERNIKLVLYCDENLFKVK